MNSSYSKTSLFEKPVKLNFKVVPIHEAVECVLGNSHGKILYIIIVGDLVLTWENPLSEFSSKQTRAVINNFNLTVLTI